MGNGGIIEILDRGCYRGSRFYILSFGTHPTAYVEIPKNHRFYKIKDYDNIPIICHGGLTYMSDIGLKTVCTTEGKFIGWDYAHVGDYFGGLHPLEGKKWTTEEILEEVTNVIDQLKRFENPFYYWWYRIKRKFRK